MLTESLIHKHLIGLEINTRDNKSATSLIITMKKHLIVILLFINTIQAYSQLKLEILELNISQITVNLHDSTWIEGED